MTDEQSNATPITRDQMAEAVDVAAMSCDMDNCDSSDIRAAVEELRRTCEWKRWAGRTSDVITTSCGQQFKFDVHLTPADCNLKFCGHCGGTLVDFDDAELKRHG